MKQPTDGNSKAESWAEDTQAVAALLEVVCEAARVLSHTAHRELLDQVVAMVGEALKATRLTLFENHADLATGRVMAMARAGWGRGLDAEREADRSERDDAVLVPRHWLEAFASGAVAGGVVAEWPSDERESLGAKPPYSAWAAPVFVDGVWGFVRADMDKTAPPWNRVLDRTLTTVATLIGGYLLRRNSEMAHTQDDIFLRTLMETTIDFVYFKDRESRYTRINAALAHFLGVARPEDAIGHTDRDCYSEEDVVDTEALEALLFESGQPIVDRVVQRKCPRDGSPRRLASTKMPIRNVKGEIMGLVGITRDITARKIVD